MGPANMCDAPEQVLHPLERNEHTYKHHKARLAWVLVRTLPFLNVTVVPLVVPGPVSGKEPEQSRGLLRYRW